MDTVTVVGVRRSITGLVEALPELVDLCEDDPEYQGPAELGQTIQALATAVGQLDAALSRAIGVFDRRGDHGLDGAPSAASWVAGRTELSAASLTHVVRRSRTLRDLPITEEAYRAGVLGTAKIGLLLTARDGVEDTYERDEQLLIDSIRNLRVSHAAVVLRRWRELARSLHGPSDDTDDGPPPPDPAPNTLTVASTFEGNRVITGSAGRIDGAVLENRIDAEIDRLFSTGEFQADDGLSRAQRAWIALDRLTARGAERSTVAGAARPSVTVIVDLNHLLGLHATSTAELLAHRCELADGTVVSLAEVLALGADATITTVLGHFGLDGTFRPAGEITTNRHANAAQRRALTARDQTCGYPGCDRRATWCDAHHVDEWHTTHRTTTSRLVLLCPFHHHRIAHGPDHTLDLDDQGAVTVTRADGTRIPTTAPGHKIPTAPDPPPFEPHALLAEARTTLDEATADAIHAELVRHHGPRVLRRLTATLSQPTAAA